MPAPIPFYSLAAQHKQIERQVQAAFAGVYNDGRFILADRLRKFEEELAAYIGSRYCIGVANGLDAIYIALKIAGVGAGHEVIVPANTYIATWLAVSRAGAVPVPVEAHPDTWLMDVAQIEQAITPRTKAIVPVHLFGLVCDMAAINAIADQYRLTVVEDNAQATGAACRDKKTGSWGHCNAFSFYPTKTLGALGDGGAVMTNDEAFYRQALLYRNYGSGQHFVNEIKGVNSRLDELQAAWLSAKLPYLEEWNRQRGEIAALYRQQLQGLEVQMPVPLEQSTPVYHLFPVKVKKRDALRARLKAQGIETSIHYPIPPYLQKAYEELGIRAGSFPVTESLAQTTLSLPVWPGLTRQEISRICEEVKKGIK